MHHVEVNGESGIRYEVVFHFLARRIMIERLKDVIASYETYCSVSAILFMNGEGSRTVADAGAIPQLHFGTVLFKRICHLPPENLTEPNYLALHLCLNNSRLMSAMLSGGTFGRRS